MNTNKEVVSASTQKKWYKKWWVWVIGFVVFSNVIVSISSPTQTTVNTNTNTQQLQKEQEARSEKAKKELKELMDMEMKAGVVHSYEFSESASVVFVDSNWYGQTVTQKKDFIAYVGMHKKDMQGYSHFEVRDAYSNEKVAEMTSFSSSIEVYK